MLLYSYYPELSGSSGAGFALQACLVALLHVSADARQSLARSLASFPGLRLFLQTKDSNARQEVTSQLTRPIAALASLHSVHPGLLHMPAGHRPGQLIGSGSSAGRYRGRAYQFKCAYLASLALHNCRAPEPAEFCEGCSSRTRVGLSLLVPPNEAGAGWDIVINSTNLQSSQNPLNFLVSTIGDPVCLC